PATPRPSLRSMLPCATTSQTTCCPANPSAKNPPPAEKPTRPAAETPKSRRRLQLPLQAPPVVTVGELSARTRTGVQSAFAAHPARLRWWLRLVRTSRSAPCRCWYASLPAPVEQDCRR